MPMKTRFAKRRLDPRVEAECWEMVFEAGRDYFSDLDALGFRTHDQKIAGARAAWARFGDLFMARRTQTDDESPWALNQFGMPGNK